VEGLRGHVVTNQETATVLAALRRWQAEFGKKVLEHEEEASFFDHFDEVEPLTCKEIDDLCERLNLGDVKVRYQDSAKRTEAPIGKSHRARLGNITRLVHGVMGLTTEVGELWSTVKKHVFYGVPLDVKNLEEELGDVQWYAAQVANALSVDLEEVQRKNIEKLKLRYPGKFTEEAAVERRDKWAQWNTHCPDCGCERLYVVEVVLMATGRRLGMHLPLCADGFEVPTDEKDASTTDEVVTCDNCGGKFELSQLAIHSE
jgi:NTP pyrophosphatase (non-canonical NTP hydrolase)